MLGEDLGDTAELRVQARLRRDVNCLVAMGDPSTLEQMARVVTTLAQFTRHRRHECRGQLHLKSSGVIDRLGLHEVLVALFGACPAGACQECLEVAAFPTGAANAPAIAVWRDKALEGLEKDTDEWRALMVARLTREGKSNDVIALRLGIPLKEVRANLHYAHSLEQYCRSDPRAFWSWLCEGD